MSASNSVLVLGAAGLLGSHVTRAIAGLGDFAVLRQTTERFSTATSLHEYLSRFDGLTVVNCIGYKGADATNHFLINGCLPRALADWSHARGALNVQVSTNAVFAPSENKTWHSMDRHDPQTPYEVSKSFGEDPRAWVLRVSFVGLARGRAGVLDDLVNGRPYWDRTWNGVTATALARRIAIIVAKNGGKSIPAVEHVHSPGVTTMSAVAGLIGSQSPCMALLIARSCRSPAACSHAASHCASNAGSLRLWARTVTSLTFAQLLAAL